MKIAIIVSQFNKKISNRLLAGAEMALNEAKIHKNDWQVFEVPGAFEIPMTAQRLIDSKKFDGIIALGCILKGETDHYKAVCEGVTYGLQKIAIENRVPVMFGVLMCERLDQAMLRSQNIPKHNKGYECVKGLLEILKNTYKSQ